MDLSLRLLADASGAQGAFSDLGSAATAAGKVLLDFAKESAKAFAESERVQKQLARAAGENTEKFTELADAMSEQLAVEDEQIKSMQTLLLNYGTLPEHVEGATRAILDYAAATGRDARDATMQLIRGIETGNGTLGRMGVTFDATGTKAGDMAQAIDALGKKFGGAAATDADSLAGRARAADIAVGELKETFGALFGLLEQKTGVLAGITHALQGLKALMTDEATQLLITGRILGDSDAGIAQRMLGLGLQKGLERGPGGGGGDDFELSMGKMSLTRSKKGGGGGGGFHESALQNEANFQHRMRVLRLQGYEQDLKDEDEHNEKKIKALKAMDELLYQQEQDRQKASRDAVKKATEEWERGMKEIQRFNEEQRREAERMTAAWLDVGKAIGSAVVNGIINGLRGGAEGKGQKTEAIIFGVIADVMSVVVSMLLSQLGAGFATPATNAFFAEWKNKGPAGESDFMSQHTGGFIERFHSGGPVLARDERMAILQTGEHVTSRADVNRLGGRQGVEAALRGGGGGLTIYAFDAASMLDQFGGGNAHRAMINAARTGRGQLRLLFAGGRM